MSKVLITTVPFAEIDPRPLQLLEQAGVEYLVNPFHRKLTEVDLINLVNDFDAIIAGTEPISRRVLDKAVKLQFIARVGIGLDSVDLLAAEERGVKVSYTPDAPAPAVSELTIGLMLSLLRSIHTSNLKMHRGEWQRFFGRRLSEVTTGVIGIGRVGRKVVNHLQEFNPKGILVNDLNRERLSGTLNDVRWVEKDEIYRTADIISVHVPLTPHTQNMITKNELLSMKQDALIVNTARGGIVNERDLEQVLKSGHLYGAAVDVFMDEPYRGPLSQVDRCLLTSHMGSMSVDCRTQMEVEATAETIRFLSGESLKSEVPNEEYELQRQGSLA